VTLRSTLGSGAPSGGPRRSSGARPSGVEHLADLLVASGFADASIVPGRPATALQLALAARQVRVVDAGNERSAAELAFGWSSVGRPALVVVKGNGAWLAAEPIQNMAVHGIGAPILVLVGDDVDAASSTVATDSRLLGAAASVVVVDHAAGQLGDAAVAAAIDASIVGRRPAVIRFTAALDGDVVAAAGQLGDGPPDPTRASGPALTVAGRAHHLTKRARHHEATATWEPDTAARWSDAAAILPGAEAPGASIGIVAVGSAIDLAQQLDAPPPVLALQLVHPFPDAAVARFAASFDRLLVVERGLPVVEDLVQLALARAGGDAVVLGQRTGHLGRTGPARPDELQEGLAAARDGDAGRTSVAALAGQGSDAVHDAARPTRFDAVLRALGRVLEGASPRPSVHTCVGSCIAAAYPPHQLATTALELGGSIAVAAGAASGGDAPAVALIGDYGLVHSGLPDHDLVHRYGWPVLTLVLADGRSTKTGGQPSACAVGDGALPALPLRQVLAVGAATDRVSVVVLDEASEAQLEDAIASALDDLPRTIVIAADDAAVDREP
jgi:indolepyruvate ferredoxin oxidoreductase alpha subunit